MEAGRGSAEDRTAMREDGLIALVVFPVETAINLAAGRAGTSCAPLFNVCAEILEAPSSTLIDDGTVRVASVSPGREIPRDAVGSRLLTLDTGRMGFGPGSLVVVVEAPEARGKEEMVEDVAGSRSAVGRLAGLPATPEWSAELAWV